MKINIQTCFAIGKETYEEREIYQPFASGIIDPDWPYTLAPGVKEYSKKEGAVPLSGFTRNRDESLNQYKAKDPLSIEDLSTLPIGDLIGCYLFMWTVSPFLLGGIKKSRTSAALYLMEKWGFEPCSMLTWGKYNLERIRKGEQTGGYGGVGYWFLGNAEFVIVGKKSGMPSIRTGTSSLFIEPKQKHSAKPNNIHELMNCRFPGPYVEVFGRRSYPGWVVLGDEAPGDGRDIRESISERILGF
jgi:N6-adenosine-specific RNA methylase IME4